MSKTDYSGIYKHYESCFDKHGNRPEGFDWPNREDLEKRFGVLTGILPAEGSVSLLDFGCGSGFLADYLNGRGWTDRIAYTGLDISEKFIAAARQTHPDREFLCRDILKEPLEGRQFDYAILNGVFTMKVGMDQEAMKRFMLDILTALFGVVRQGIAFNVMSKLVDWERDDLFHLGMDELGEMLWKNLSRHFVMRNDYGLYEYTTYVYKTPNL